MNWIYIVIGAHFLNALVFIFDKYILSHTKLKPNLYAFYIGVFGLFAFVLAPWGFELISLSQILISFLAGGLFVYAILFFYKAVQMDEVSRITPIIGGAVPVFTLLLTYLILPERLNFIQLSAFVLLVLGSVIIIWPRKRESKEYQGSLGKKISIALIAALFFAGSFVLSKYLFNTHTFVNIFLWTRIGAFLAGVTLLPWVWKALFSGQGMPKKSALGIVAISKLLSISSFLLLNYAIFLGNVTLVNAMQGVQYFFLLIIAIFLSSKFPNVLEEQISRGVVLKKIIAIILIMVGIGILVFK